MDPAMLARAQQQYMGAQYAQSPIQRQQGFPMQAQISYSPVDPYGYGMSPSQFSPMDPRFGQQAQFMMGGMPTDMGITRWRCCEMTMTDHVCSAPVFKTRLLRQRSDPELS